jgi:hypothetical protein
MPQYGAGELLWYLSGRDDLKMIEAYAPSYSQWSDNGVSLFGAYGPRIKFNQIVDMLRGHEDSRRVVVPIYGMQHFNAVSKNVPCTSSWQFLVENGRLNMVCTMRSNDAWLGMPYDVWVATLIQWLLADELGLELGWYQHQAGSLHLYEQHTDKAREVEAEAGWDFDFDKGEYTTRTELRVALELERNLRGGGDWLAAQKMLVEYGMVRRQLGMAVWLCASNFSVIEDPLCCPWTPFYERAMQWSEKRCSS